MSQDQDPQQFDDPFGQFMYDVAVFLRDEEQAASQDNKHDGDSPNASNDQDEDVDYPF